jgi:REP element-mobilizing transposase RayT
MPGTFSQLYVHIVFAVQSRNALINSSWEERLYQYITAIVQNKGQKMIAINGMPDHIHLFVGMKPNFNVSDLVREVKKASNDFINEKAFTKVRFNWQEGYGAFSYSHSQVSTVANYVMNQKNHHRKKTFEMEYQQLLKTFEIDYKNEYLFDWIELNCKV